MILQNLNVFEIRRDALQSLSKGSNRLLFFFIYYLLPLVISFLLYKYNYYLGKDVSGNLISGISLLSGLMFSLLVVITSNFTSRKNQLISKDEEVIRYLDNYKKFANSLIAVISYSLIKSILIILLLVFVSSYLDYLNQTINCVIKICWFIIYVLLYQYVVLFLFIINNMYAMLHEDINRK